MTKQDDHDKMTHMKTLLKNIPTTELRRIGRMYNVKRVYARTRENLISELRNHCTIENNKIIWDKKDRYDRPF